MNRLITAAIALPVLIASIIFPPLKILFVVIAAAAVCVALNYGGRAEIVDAVRAAARALAADGRSAEELTDEDISRHLYTRGLPELDLLVRTSGELRISNFLLWQAAYSEIYVTQTLWPDFRRADLLEAVVDFQRRDRRFGGLKLVANAK